MPAPDRLRLSGLPSAGGPHVPPPEVLRARGGKKWKTYARGVLPMWIADMDFDVAEPIRTVVAEAATAGAFAYPSEDLYAAVGGAFVHRMETRFGWAPDPAGVELLADLVQGLVTTVMAATDPGDAVVTLTPVYPPFLMAAQTAGRRLVPVDLRPERDYRVDPDELAAAVGRSGARLLLLCNPHNPTGRVLDADELTGVAEVARRFDLLVVSDEVHADLVLDRVEHRPFALISGDTRERTITLQSASKAFNLGGLRCGVAHFGSDALRRRFEARFPPRALGRVTAPSARAMVAAWTHGDPWLAKVVDQLRANRDALGAWIRSVAPAVTWTPPQATYLAWLGFTAWSDAEDGSAARDLLGSARVALSPGEDFGGPQHSHRARLNFATSPELLDRGLTRIGAALGAITATPDGTRDPGGGQPPQRAAATSTPTRQAGGEH
jgi:cystathionine beta-lyase